MVRDGLDGYLVSAGDAEGAAAKLALLAGDPELRRRLGEAGRTRMLGRYSVERLVRDIDELYKELIARRQPARAAVPDRARGFAG